MCKSVARLCLFYSSFFLLAKKFVVELKKRMTRKFEMARGLAIYEYYAHEVNAGSNNGPENCGCLERENLFAVAPLGRISTCSFASCRSSFVSCTTEMKFHSTRLLVRWFVRWFVRSLARSFARSFAGRREYFVRMDTRGQRLSLQGCVSSWPAKDVPLSNMPRTHSQQLSHRKTSSIFLLSVFPTHKHAHRKRKAVGLLTRTIFQIGSMNVCRRGHDILTGICMLVGE